MTKNSSVDAAMIGAEFSKSFPGHGRFKGVVVSADNGMYQVQYPKDGDEEELTAAELAKLIPKTAKKAIRPVEDEEARITPVGGSKRGGRGGVRVKKINYSELSDEGSEYEDDKDAKDEDDEDEEEEYQPSSNKRKGAQQSDTDDDDEDDNDDAYLPAAKRPRVQQSTGKARAKPRGRGPKLRSVLESLDKKQLVDLVVALANDDDAGDGSSSIDARVRELMPEPDVGVDALVVLKNKIYRAFPYSRYGSSRDNYSYNRVSPAITAFKKEFNAKLTSLNKGGSPIPTLRFIVAAAGVVDGLPCFDREEKNKYKAVMNTRLFKTGTAAIKKASKADAAADLSPYQEAIGKLDPENATKNNNGNGE